MPLAKFLIAKFPLAKLDLAKLDLAKLYMAKLPLAKWPECKNAGLPNDSFVFLKMCNESSFENVFPMHV